MQFSVARLSHFKPLLDVSQLVTRECGQDVLNAILESGKKLTYLESAPGYGKSCVMTQAYELVSQQRKSAWCAFSPEHREPLVLLRLISQALQRTVSGVGSVTEALIQSIDGVDVNIVTAMLINELHTADSDVVLFFDNVHQLSTTDGLELIADIIESSHQRIKFVVASRASLPARFEFLLPLGQLCHIPQEAFRLSVLEASAILSQRFGVELAGDQVNALLSQIDAWPIALNLIGEYFDGDSSFAPEIFMQEKYLTPCYRYFDEQVMAGLNAAQRKSLFELAQLNTITEPLGDFFDPACQETLTLLRNDNLFLFTMEVDHSYRLHNLFHQYLLTRSQELPQSRIVSIHQQVFEWCFNVGNYQEAVFHALAIKDWHRVVSVVERFRIEIMTHNQLRAAAGWIESLPSDLVKTRPKLLLILSWCYALQGAREKAVHYLSEIDEAGLASLHETEAHDVALELDALNCVIMMCRGRYDELEVLCERYNHLEIDASNIFKNVQAAGLVYALFNTGHHDQAHRLAVKLESGGDQTNLLALVYRHIFRGMAYRLDGRLQQAKAEYEKSIIIAADIIGDPLLRFSVSDALLSEIYYEWGDVSNAKRYLPLQEVLGKDSVTVEPIIAAYLTSARIAADEGQNETALDILAQGESYGCREGYDRVVANMLGERVVVLLKQNKTDEAKSLVAELDSLAERRALRGNAAAVWSDIEYCRGVSATLLEQSVGSIDVSASLHVLSVLAEQATRANRKSELIKITLLEAVTYDQCGKHKTALRKATQAIALASSGLLLSSLCGLSNKVVVLLRKALKNWDSEKASVPWSGDQSYISRLKQHFDVPERDVLEQVGGKGAIEALSGKDTTLLQYLGEGLKNREIAEAMSLSENTIAWHLKNLYGKLHASNRTSAVNIARQLRLI
ncbi:Serine/threonine-protein kinase PknK [Zhongshania aliphaticivorans]|uniref:Serine/threonine-protein kinase PknK n=1 Tax=Zhongshania aliphaticivorans TaxID=1470434 RepID=A0A5S9Q2N9_9GAMM|nr:LuxR C-terminal-related transcriptional regulator [Zhongshania aliphaticivorans]CAA0111469.1 Serine/threonine-protein kinase PknK [Zhongshania aliphaticivorans]CAA0118646.1 Serine/threonine-protein kinase PknK [Zhongshania aliphaticivorans]